MGGGPSQLTQLPPCSPPLQRQVHPAAAGPGHGDLGLCLLGRLHRSPGPDRLWADGLSQVPSPASEAATSPWDLPPSLWSSLFPSASPCLPSRLLS